MTEARWSFPLALLFQEVLLLAVVFASIRLLPSDQQMRQTLTLAPYWREIILLSCAGTAAGAALGGFQRQMRRGALIGLGISLPAAIVWTFLAFYRHAMVT